VSSARAGKSGGRAQSKSERAALRWRRHAVARRGTRWPSGKAERGREGAWQTGEGQGKMSQAKALCSRARAWRQHVAATWQAPSALGRP
jgi:hypothetical protein